MRPRMPTALAPLLLAGLALIACQDDHHPTAPSISRSASQPAAQNRPSAVRGNLPAGQSTADFTKTFPLDRCSFASRGRNPFFILEPGYTSVFEGRADGVAGSLTIRVLDETERVGGVRTRVVEERHVEDGELVEVSRNFFAICTQNNSVFYFGEASTLLEHGKVVSREGSWRHGENGARAGLVMPGLPLLGARYFQEVAPDVALDQAEIVDLAATIETPKGRFTDVLRTRETTPLEPGVVEFKSYALGVGLVQDAELRLVSAGFPPGRGDAESDGEDDEDD